MVVPASCMAPVLLSEVNVHPHNLCGTEQCWLARCMCFSFLCCCEFFNVLPVDSSGKRKPWHSCRNENNTNNTA